MFHLRNDDLVAFLQESPAPALRDKIDAFGRPADEDDLVFASRIDKFRDLAAGCFKTLCRPLAKVVHTAMNIRVLMLIDLGNRIDHLLRLLGARG